MINNLINNRLKTAFLMILGMSTFIMAQEGSVSGRVTEALTG